MIASLNHSSSDSSLASTLMSGAKFTGSSGEAAKDQGGVRLLIDAQPHAAPLDHVTLARDQIFNGPHPVPCSLRTNLDITEMKPEFPRTLLCERYRNRNRIVEPRSFLHVTDHVVIIHLRE